MHLDVFIRNNKNLNFVGPEKFCRQPVKIIFSGAHIGILNSFKRIQGFIAQIVATVNIRQLGFGIHIKNKAIERIQPLELKLPLRDLPAQRFHNFQRFGDCG